MRILCAVALAALLAPAVHAACPYPAPPTHQIPDGRTATQQEMNEGQQAVDEYNAAVETYVKCLDAESEDKISKAGATMTDAQKDEVRRITAQRHSAAILQRDEIGVRFTEQMRAFKAKEKERHGF